MCGVETYLTTITIGHFGDSVCLGWWAFWAGQDRTGQFCTCCWQAGTNSQQFCPTGEHGMGMVTGRFFFVSGGDLNLLYPPNHAVHCFGNPTVWKVILQVVVG